MLPHDDLVALGRGVEHGPDRGRQPVDGVVERDVPSQRGRVPLDVERDQDASGADALALLAGDHLIAVAVAAVGTLLELGASDLDRVVPRSHAVRPGAYAKARARSPFCAATPSTHSCATPRSASKVATRVPPRLGCEEVQAAGAVHPAGDQDAVEVELIDDRADERQAFGEGGFDVSRPPIRGGVAPIASQPPRHDLIRELLEHQSRRAPHVSDDPIWSLRRTTGTRSCQPAEDPPDDEVLRGVLAGKAGVVPEQHDRAPALSQSERQHDRQPGRGRAHPRHDDHAEGRPAHGPRAGRGALSALGRTRLPSTRSTTRPRTGASVDRCRARRSSSERTSSG